MMRPRATPAASTSWRRNELPPATTWSASATRTPSGRRPRRSAAAQRVVRIGDDEHARRGPRWSSRSAVPASDSYVVRPAPPCTIASPGRRVDEVPRRGLGLGEAVARLLATGDDDERGDALVHSSTTWSRRAASCGDGLPSYWAAPSTTMASTGRAWSLRPVDYTWTRLTRSSQATSRSSEQRPADDATAPTPTRRDRRRRRRRRGRRRRRSPWPIGRIVATGVRRDGARSRHRRSSSAAAAPRPRSRRSVSSRPSTSSDSNSGGPTLRPVTATRTGAWALPSLMPCEAPTRSSTRLQRRRRPTSRARRRRRSRRAPPATTAGASPWSTSRRR